MGAWGRARLLRRRQDAWRPSKVGQGLDARALTLCGLQRRLDVWVAGCWCVRTVCRVVDSWSVTGLLTGIMQHYPYQLDSDSGISLPDTGCYLCYLVNSFM